MMLLRTILITATALSLSGCVVTLGVPDKNGFVTIKPTAAQFQAAARELVCQSFTPITFSAKGDSKTTIGQVRRHNAALRTFKCP